MTKLDVLQNLSIEGLVVKLPPVQLDRKIYLEVAKALELIGGKWKGGKVAGFVFEEDPSPYLDQLAEGGNLNLQKEFQFFATPAPIAAMLCDYAQLQQGYKVLEPSAGSGAIIAQINLAGITPDCFELMPLNLKKLENSGLNYNLLGEDFLAHKPAEEYDAIIANPPFSQNQDITHVEHMFKCLKPGGRLVSITGKTWTFGSQRKHIAFREWIKELGGETETLPAGTFKSSGTMVETIIIILDKP